MLGMDVMTVNGGLRRDGSVRNRGDTLGAPARLQFMGALMNPEYSWPKPPEGGWTADDLDTLPNLPPHTELIDGSLIFVGPQTLFHSRAVSFFERQIESLAPEGLEVLREFTIDIDRHNRPEPDVIAATARPNP
ncbi:hypothetical protein GCM10017778_34060 [Streptomyces vinaceus]|nr:hypothetical protein GCM10017778_34060 [Streptomyces vinaceus]